MNKIDQLRDYAKKADIHSQYLLAALSHMRLLTPLSASSLANSAIEDVAFLDLLTTRFGKLQDVIGAKIFPFILDILGEDASTFRDKLNRLEKLGIIKSANWWMQLREIRNLITHDYPDDYEQLATHFNQLFPYIESLLAFWGDLQDYIARL